MPYVNIDHLSLDALIKKANPNHSDTDWPQGIDIGPKVIDDPLRTPTTDG